MRERSSEETNVRDDCEMEKWKFDEPFWNWNEMENEKFPFALPFF